MCEISNKIKFCTCDASEKKALTNYWVFYRGGNRINLHVVGDVMFKDWQEPESRLQMQKVLLIRLNEPDAFDVNLQPTDDDYLDIVLKCSEYGEEFRFTFEYWENQWVLSTPMIDIRPRVRLNEKEYAGRTGNSDDESVTIGKIETPFK